MPETSESADRVRLIVHDDDDTPRSFVIDLVHTVFGQPKGDANAITRMIERQGRVSFGPYEPAVAATILEQAQQRVKEARHPLKITKESAEPGKEAGGEPCHFCGEEDSETEFFIGGQTRFICGDCAETVARAAGFRRSGVEFNYAFELLARQFEEFEPHDLVSTVRHFPVHMRADLQAALDKVLDKFPLFGVRQHHRYDTVNYAKLCESGDNAYPLAVPRYREIDIGEAAPVRCLENGLWLGAQLGDTEKPGGIERFPFVVVLSPNRDPDEEPSVAVEFTAPEWGAEFVQQSFAALESAVGSARAYRGKVLSFDGGTDYRGRSRGLMVHRLPKVAREDVILPEATTKLLDRNVLRFVETREQLRALGLSTRKGILLYGPPGTARPTPSVISPAVCPATRR